MQFVCIDCGNTRSGGVVYSIKPLHSARTRPAFGERVMSAQKTLTPRQTLILRFIAWGYTNSEIADHFNISMKTVEAHKARAMSKLGFTRRAQLVRYAVDQGWLVADAAPHRDDGPMERPRRRRGD
jgi:DNA-binding NarL/FixJ family response regulator